MNNVQLTGRLTKNVELKKTTASGVSVARITLAVRKNQETSDFINVTCYKQQAEFLSNYAKKGTLISVDGRLNTGSFEKNGQKVYFMEVIANNVEILSQPKEQEQKPQEFSVDEFVGFNDNDLPF